MKLHIAKTLIHRYIDENNNSILYLVAMNTFCLQLSTRFCIKKIQIGHELSIKQPCKTAFV